MCDARRGWIIYDVVHEEPDQRVPDNVEPVHHSSDDHLVLYYLFPFLMIKIKFIMDNLS